MRATGVDPGRQPWKLHRKNGRLQGVESVVASERQLVLVLSERAVGTELLNARRELGVVRHDRARIAESAERLRGMKAVATETSERPHLSVAVRRSERLRRIFDEGNAPLVRERAKLAELGGLPEQVNHEDRLRPWAQDALNGARIERKGVRAYVREHRCRSGASDRSRCRKERQRRGNDLVAGPDAERQQRQEQRIAPTLHA